MLKVVSVVDEEIKFGTFISRSAFFKFLQNNGIEYSLIDDEVFHLEQDGEWVDDVKIEDSEYIW